MIRAICSLLVIALAVSSQNTKSEPSSPCPNVFTYEPPGSGEKPGPGAAKWYGLINLTTDITLHALWLNIILDSKADILGNWVGEVTTEDNFNFKIENTKMILTPGAPIPVRFFIQYNAQGTVPKLQSILFNGREICVTETAQAIEENSYSTAYNYSDYNGVPVRTDTITTTQRSTTVPTTKNVYDRSQTKSQYRQQTTLKPNQWTTTKAITIQTTTEKSQSKYQTTKSWNWVQPKIESTTQAKPADSLYTKNKDQKETTSGSNSQSKSQSWPQNKSDNNRQTTSSHSKVDIKAQSNLDKLQSTSQVWPQTKTTTTTEGYSRVASGSSSYSKPQTWTAEKVDDNQQLLTENIQQISTGDNSKFQLFSQIKVDTSEQIRHDNKQSSFGSFQPTTENTYNKAQVWSPNKEESNQQTRQQNTQSRPEEKSQVSVVSSQYYPQSNVNNNQQSEKRTEFEDNLYVHSQNTQPRRPGSASHAESSSQSVGHYGTSVSLQKEVTTETFQLSGTKKQVRPVESAEIKPVNLLPDRKDGVFEVRPINRQQAETLPPRSSGTYSWSPDEPKLIFESAGSRNTAEREGIREVNIRQQSSANDYSLPILRPAVAAPALEEFIIDDDTKEDDYEEVGVDFGLPAVYIPNLTPVLACGRVTKKPPRYLSYGSTTSEGQWPWQAALYQQQTVDFKYICGGTLVSHRHVITAAHCVARKMSAREVNKNTLTVYLGKFNLRTSVDGVQVKFVKRILIHPAYNASIFSRDLAILELRESVSFTDWVKPACLWPENKIGRRNIVGKKGSVVGWGFDVAGAPREELSLLEMPVVDQETCINSYIDFYEKFTSDYTYCAGYKDGTSVCNGDSGGGMVFKRGNAWYLRGVASLSVARQNEYRCDPRHYVIFTDIAKFLPWIEEHID